MPEPQLPSLDKEFTNLEKAMLALRQARDTSRLSDDDIVLEPFDEIAALHQAKCDLVSAVANGITDAQNKRFETVVRDAMWRVIEEAKKESAASLAAVRELLPKP